MADAIVHRAVFLGGPCDGHEQAGNAPPPTPEFVQPRGARDAVYTLESEKGGVYRYRFTGYRERPKSRTSGRKPKPKE
jgi:hypothetical protein